MRRLTIVNRTDDIVTYYAEHHHIKAGVEAQTHFVYPSTSVTVDLPSHSADLRLSQAHTKEKVDYSDEVHSVAPDEFTVRAPLSLGAMWKGVKVPESCPWTIYRIKVRIQCCVYLVFAHSRAEGHQKPPPAAHSPKARHELLPDLDIR